MRFDFLSDRFQTEPLKIYLLCETSPHHTEAPIEWAVALLRVLAVSSSNLGPETASPDCGFKLHPYASYVEVSITYLTPV